MIARRIQRSASKIINLPNVGVDHLDLSLCPSARRHVRRSGWRYYDAVAFQTAMRSPVAHGATALGRSSNNRRSTDIEFASADDLIRIAVSQSHRTIPVIAREQVGPPRVDRTHQVEKPPVQTRLFGHPVLRRPAQQLSRSTRSRRQRPAGSSSMMCHHGRRPELRIKQSCGRPIAAGDRPQRCCRDTTRPARLRSLLGQFQLLCGDVRWPCRILAQGGDGCISVTSNVAPSLCRNMFLASKRASVRAQRLARAAAPLTTHCSGKQSLPREIRVGAARSHAPAVRLPLVELSLHYRTEIGEVLLRLCDDIRSS